MESCVEDVAVLEEEEMVLLVVEVIECERVLL